MSKFQDSSVQQLDQYHPEYSSLTESQVLEDPDYNEKYYRQHADSVWDLPSTPFTLSIDLKNADTQERQQMCLDLGMDPEYELDDFDRLEVYVERIEGQIDYLVINDIRYEFVEDIPGSVRRFLDNVTFGDAESPVITSSGARINIWDAIRGEPESQQAFYEAGYYDEQGQLEVTGIMNPVSSIDKLEDKPVASLQDTIQTRVVDMQVKQHLDDKEKTGKRTRRKAGILLLLIACGAGLAALYFTGYLPGLSG